MAFGDVWIALADGAGFDEYLSGSGQYADEALELGRLADQVRERCGVASG